MEVSLEFILHSSPHFTDKLGKGSRMVDVRDTYEVINLVKNSMKS